MFVCCECCVLSGRGLCDGLITHPEKSYRLWRVVVCDQETSKTRRLKPATGLWKIQPQWVITPGKQTNKQTPFITPTKCIVLINTNNKGSSPKSFHKSVPSTGRIKWHSSNNQRDATLHNGIYHYKSSTSVFLNRRPAARYRALASIIPGRDRPEETTICYKISLVQLITNLNVILYFSTCHTVYISVLTLFMIMP